jgi:hypothetical protein
VINVSLNCLLFIFAFVVRVVVDVSTAGVFQTILVAILQKSTTRCAFLIMVFVRYIRD